MVVQPTDIGASPIKLTTSKFIDIKYGDILSIYGTSTAPRNFSSGGKTFDYVDYLLKDDIRLVMLTNDVQVVHPAGFSLTGILYKLKEDFIENLRRVLG